MPTRVILEPLGAVIRPVALPGGAEALARRAADDDVDGTISDDGSEGGGGQLRQVGLQREADGREAGRRAGLEVFAQGGDGLRIGVHRGEALEPGPQHPERETAAARKEIDESRVAHRSIPSHNAAAVVFSAKASRVVVRSVALRSPRSIPLM